ncbi:MAG: tol-pal system protein YbgF [Proteobacteria bacterium]|nr:tol-pal system protein YbgF [Pseudomonadota bacterium]
MTQPRLIAAAALVAVTLASTPAHAQVFGGKRQDEAIAAIQARIAELQEAHRTAQAEIKAVTQAHNSTKGELTAASARVDDMEATVKSLNGTAETLAADLATARRDLGAAQAQNRDLLERLARVESAQAALTVASGSSAVPAAATAPSDPVAAFAAARALMDGGRFAEAGDAFEAYASAHASQPNAAEANYWLGETLYLRENYGEAAQAYIVALKGWPKSSWAPDALVKLSSSLIALKQPAEACKTLGEFDRRYGSAPAALKTRARSARAQAKCAA